MRAGKERTRQIMIELILLLFLCMKLQAPVWCYVLIEIKAIINTVTFGFNLGKDGN